MNLLGSRLPLLVARAKPIPPFQLIWCASWLPLTSNLTHQSTATLTSGWHPRQKPTGPRAGMPHTAQKQNCGGDGVTICCCPTQRVQQFGHITTSWCGMILHTLHQPNFFENRRNASACTSLITHLVLRCVWPTHLLRLDPQKKASEKNP